MENIEQENTQEVQQEIQFIDGRTSANSASSISDAPKVAQLVLPKEAKEEIERIKREYMEMEMRDNR